MAEVCTGIDFIMGGHTHDGVPEAVPVKIKKVQLMFVMLVQMVNS